MRKTTDEMLAERAVAILGKVTVILARQLVLGQDDACRCGRRLSDLYAIYLADCGRYCSRGCAEAHADTIAHASYVAGQETGWVQHLRLQDAGLLKDPRDA